MLFLNKYRIKKFTKINSLFKSACKSLIIIFALQQLIGCNNEKVKEDNIYMLQCIGRPLKGSQSKEFETMFGPNKVKCHALLWRIPKEYKPDVRELSAWTNEYITKEIRVMDAPLSVIPSWVPKDSEHEGLNGKSEILFKEYWEPSNMTLFENFVRNETSPTVGYKKIEHGLNGWDIYSNEGYKDENGYATLTAILFKKLPVEYFLKCELERPHGTYMQLSKNQSCTVKTNIDGRVYAEYRIKYEHFKQMDLINNNVILFAKNLMLN